MAALGTITDLTIHCTATPEGLPCTPQQISAMDVARFGQVSYHWVITLDGGKHNTLSDSIRGAHTGKHNTGNVGISYVGGIDAVTKKPKDTRTAAQKQALLDLVRDYKKRFPGIRVRGHRDWSPDLNGDGKISPNEWVKSCPCFDVAAWLKAEGV